eukprot:scaffold451217_cov55-Prasinocladus_malaysianus.AAC.1
MEQEMDDLRAKFEQQIEDMRSKLEQETQSAAAGGLQVTLGMGSGWQSARLPVERSIESSPLIRRKGF